MRLKIAILLIAVGFIGSGCLTSIRVICENASDGSTVTADQGKDVSGLGAVDVSPKTDLLSKDTEKGH